MIDKASKTLSLFGSFESLKKTRFYQSLTLRVIVISTILAFSSLIVAATIIQGLYAKSIEKRFDDTLKAQLFNVITSVYLNDDNTLVGAPNLGDTRYNIPASGWYWQVKPVMGGIQGILRSTSLLDAALPSSENAPEFNSGFERSYFSTDTNGSRVRIIEAEFILGTNDKIARFSVVGNFTEVEEELRLFARQIWILLGFLGAAVIAINTLAIISGMRPLDRARQALSDIREGRSQNLDGPFPSEIQPLADELNALIDNNRRIVERSRTQVGNLAHSLKTPLAVLINEGRRSAETGLVVEQAEAMQVQVQHYLQKARIASQRNSVVFRTPVLPILERLARVISKLNPRIKVTMNDDAQDFTFPGEREDLEEIIGNLVENAAKWARSEMQIELLPYINNDEGATRFLIRVSDDGGGIPESKLKEVLIRGHRLDETTPGTGLGLAIVADLIDEYNGELKLGRSKMGGLMASVILQRSK